MHIMLEMYDILSYTYIMLKYIVETLNGCNICLGIYIIGLHVYTHIDYHSYFEQLSFMSLFTFRNTAQL